MLLEVTNADSRPGGLWVLTEQVPADLGPSPRFVVDRLPGGATTTFGYRVHGERRGRHALGPLRLRLVDPFGLVERSAIGTDSATLLVVPRVRPLGTDGPAGGHGGGGEGSRRTIAVHGEDDVSTREYRHGDDLRKVHWRATARTGELMVRLEERPWRAQATLLLDTRARAHLLAPRHAPLPRIGPDGDDCPPGRQPGVAGRGGGQHRDDAGPARGRPPRGHRHGGAGADVRPRAARPRGPAGPPGERGALPATRAAHRRGAAVPGGRRRPGGVPARRRGSRRRRGADPRAFRAPGATPPSCSTSRAGPRPPPVDPGDRPPRPRAACWPNSGRTPHDCSGRPAGGWPWPGADRSVAEVWSSLGGAVPAVSTTEDTLGTPA